jgi:hypothetical protein
MIPNGMIARVIRISWYCTRRAAFPAHPKTQTLATCARSIRQANNDAMHQGLKTVRMPATGSLLMAHTNTKKSPIVAASTC